MWIDTHAHLFSQEFEHDILEVTQRIRSNGVKKVILPNIDSSTMLSMFGLSERFPDLYFPSLGLHPGYVKANFEEELRKIELEIASRKIIAIGEVGIDLYWDKSTLALQQIALERQVNWSIEKGLPLILHTRDSFEETYEIIYGAWNRNPSVKGVFHCFSGNTEQAKRVTNLGFFLGIGGTITFKNSQLSEVLKHIDLNYLVLETDSPYLSPVPYRGKRNESSYIAFVGEKLADTLGISVEEIAELTTRNAEKLFSLNAI